MGRALGAALSTIDFAPFHRAKRDVARSRKTWEASCSTEPYDVLSGRAGGAAHQNGPSEKENSLISMDVISAIQRQQSFPFQVSLQGAVVLYKNDGSYMYACMSYHLALPNFIIGAAGFCISPVLYADTVPFRMVECSLCRLRTDTAVTWAWTGIAVTVPGQSLPGAGRVPLQGFPVPDEAPSSQLPGAHL